jgi:two-component system, NtrC family, sensor kinase
MPVDPGDPPARPARIRFAAPQAFARLSLRAQVTLLVALVVTIVVAVSSYLQIRAFEASMLTDLLETARSAAQAVANDLELRPEPLRPEDVGERLREFREAVPSVRDISVVTLTDHQPVVVASTSSRVKNEALTVAARVIEQKTMVWDREKAVIRTVAVPVLRSGRVFGAVVLTFSVASVDQLHRRGRLVVLWFVPAAIVILTLLVSLPVRRLIHRPIAGIQKTMQRVAEGDLGARAPVVRRDEIGAVAEGLNEMLAQMQNFNVELQSKVSDATHELREKNEELVESYQRMFELREALERAQQMATVGQMAANVAHQIGTPLNLISGYVQMIMEQEGDAPPVAERLQIVQEQITKVTSIVRTMLDHARRPSPKAPTDIAELVRHVAAVAGPKLDGAGVRLDLAVASDLPPVQADGVQLELALLNLITNSLDAMPGGGVASITVSRTDEGVRVQVADTGIGIGAELLPRIFEPWVTTKAAGHGTGLGLSITRDVITAHGGTITAKSAEGAGATFTIDLPAAEETAECRAS